MNQVRRVVLIGECMIELQRRDGNILQGYAGDVLNTATYLARLTDASVEVEFATALGEDQFSDQMVANWAAEAIGANLAERLPNRLPGVYFIENDASGERKFYYWRNDSAAKRMFDTADFAQRILELENLSLVYLSGISLAILPAQGRKALVQMLQQLKHQGTQIVFDNNYRPILWSSTEETMQAYDEILELADIALLTWDDERALRGFASPDEVVAHCEAFNLKELVIKCGAEPAILISEGKRSEIGATPVDKVVDTTAAGDSFSGAYLAARLQGLTPAEAVSWGHTMAGTVIQHPGAIIPLSAMPDAF